MPLTPLLSTCPHPNENLLGSLDWTPGHLAIQTQYIRDHLPKIPLIPLFLSRLNAGAEHDVFTSAAEPYRLHLVKITKKLSTAPSTPLIHTCGYWPQLINGKHIYPGPASLKAYLERIQLTNHIFKGQIHLIGYCGSGDEPENDTPPLRLITTQPIYRPDRKNRLATEKMILSYMSDYGFSPLPLDSQPYHRDTGNHPATAPIQSVFWHPRLHLLVSDAIPRNFIRISSTEIVPFDILIRHLPHAAAHLINTHLLQQQPPAHQ